MAVPVMGYFGQEFGRPLVDIFSAVIDRSTPFSPASEILQEDISKYGKNIKRGYDN